MVALDDNETFSDVITITAVIMENKCAHGTCASNEMSLFVYKIYFCILNKYFKHYSMKKAILPYCCDVTHEIRKIITMIHSQEDITELNMYFI